MSNTPAALADFDPEDPGFIADPYPGYERLRRCGPVCWSKALGHWLVTSHAETRAVLRDPAFLPFDLEKIVNDVLQGDPGLPAVREMAGAMLMTRSDDGHVILRRYLARVLNFQSVADLAPAIRRIATELLEAGWRRGGMDLVTEFGDVLPVRVVAEMLGLPKEEAPLMAESCEGVLGKLLSRTSTGSDFRAINRGIALGVDFLHSHVRERRVRPREDGLTRMIQLAPEDMPAGDRDLAVQAYFLFLAGIDTTATFLGSSMLALIQHEDEQERWRRGEVAAGAAVEELLRFAGPVQITPRRASVLRTLGGSVIEPGQRLMLILGAANRDPLVFRDPARLNLGRGGPPHISFGDGAHSCLGAALARLEGEIALSLFVTRSARRTTDPAGLWVSHEKFRKLRSLPVEFPSHR